MGATIGGVVEVLVLLLVLGCGDGASFESAPEVGTGGGTGAGGSPPMLEPPQVTAVAPAGAVGCAGEQVSFAAEVSGEADAWSWSFGGGAQPDVSEEEEPTVTLGPAGEYQGSVVASNVVGASAPLDFAFAVTAPSEPAWPSQIVDDVTPGSHGSDSSAVSLNGRLGIAYWAAQSGELHVALADGRDATAGAWSHYLLEDQGGPGWLTSSTVHQDRWVITHDEHQGRDLRIALAEQEWPADAGDWTRYTIDSAGDVGGRSSVVSLGDSLWVSYYDYSNAAVRIAGSVEPWPTDPIAWTSYALDDAQGIFGQYFTAMTSLDGRLAAAYPDAAVGGLKVARALVAEPQSAADWAIQLVDAAPDVGSQPAIAAIAGRLVVAYKDGIEVGTKIAVADIAEPAGPDDWTIYALDYQAFNLSFAIVQGRLALTIFEGVANDLWVLRADEQLPLGPEAWTAEQVVQGLAYSSVEHQGELAIPFAAPGPDGGDLWVTVSSSGGCW